MLFLSIAVRGLGNTAGDQATCRLQRPHVIILVSDGTDDELPCDSFIVDLQKLQQSVGTSYENSPQGSRPCAAEMGASDSKIGFKQGIFKLSEERNIAAHDPYWTSVRDAL